MFGECHAHIIMDGKNYKAAVSLHKVSPCEDAVREHLLAWQKAGVTFVRDGGDALNVSKLAKTLAPEYGIDYRTPLFAIHKKGHYGGIVGHAFRDMQEYRSLVLQAKADGADFIKIMISGIMDFSCFGALSEEGLPPDEIQEMIDFAHSAGMRVMAHGNGDVPVRAAVEAGVDTLEHGNYLSDSTIMLLAESPVIWVPTFAPTGNLLGCGRFPDNQVRKILKRQMSCVRRAFSLGAHLGLGSDAGAYLVPHGQGLFDEYAWFLQAVGDENQEELDRRLKASEDWIKKEMKGTTTL